MLCSALLCYALLCYALLCCVQVAVQEIVTVPICSRVRDLTEAYARERGEPGGGVGLQLLTRNNSLDAPYPTYTRLDPDALLCTHRIRGSARTSERLGPRLRFFPGERCSFWVSATTGGSPPM